MKKTQIIRNSSLILLLLIMVSYSGMAQKSKSKKDSKDVIWVMQAEGLATSFGLGKSETASLVNAYVAMRQEVNENNNAVDKKEKPEAYAENAAKNEAIGYTKIGKEINKILKDDQAKEAALLLGSFNSRWDSYTKNLLDLKLQDETQKVASKLLAEYMKSYLKERQLAEAAGERFSGRKASELKSNLDASLAEYLTTDQMAEWNTATQRKTKK